MTVVDCTVLADFFFGDAAARRAVEKLMELDPEWISHGLIFYEAGNVAWKIARSGALTVADALTCVEGTGSLLAEVETHLDFPEIFRTASGTGLTFYDASYVWLARARGLQLRTRDREILRACPDVACPMP